MSQDQSNPGNDQHRTYIQAQAPTQDADEDQSQAHNDQLNAQAAVLLNEFLAKTRRLVSTELGNDVTCTICSEPFLRGENPEVSVMLDCGHIFGIGCILKWLSPVSRNGNNSCPNCRKTIFSDWDEMDFPSPRPIAPEQRFEAAATTESATSETSTLDDTSSIVHRSSRRREPGRTRELPALSVIIQRDWEELWENWQQLLQSGEGEIYREILSEGIALGYAQSTAHDPAVAATPAPVEAAQPAGDEDNGVAAMFDAAEVEHDQQHKQEATNKRKRYMWMQFCEGVVRTIEQSDDGTAFANHDIALSIINMNDLDEFMAARTAESPTWQRVLRTFPHLHTEMVTRFAAFRPIPSVNIDHRIDLERLLAHTKFSIEEVHKARWLMRLSERVARGAAASGHEGEGAVARLRKFLPDQSCPSRETGVFATRSGAEPTPAEARGVREFEEAFLRGPPSVVGRDAAASVDTASMDAALGLNPHASWRRR